MSSSQSSPRNQVKMSSRNQGSQEDLSLLTQPQSMKSLTPFCRGSSNRSRSSRRGSSIKRITDVEDDSSMVGSTRRRFIELQLALKMTPIASLTNIRLYQPQSSSSQDESNITIISLEEDIQPIYNSNKVPKVTLREWVFCDPSESSSCTKPSIEELEAFIC